MDIKNKFTFGDMVYFVADDDQRAWMVTGIMIDPGHVIQYRLSKMVEVITAYEFELSEERDIMMTTNN